LAVLRVPQTMKGNIVRHDFKKLNLNLLNCYTYILPTRKTKHFTNHHNTPPNT